MLDVQAVSDSLTGVAARRGFEIALEKERRRCEREGATLSVIVLDVDHFRAFDDAYGHVAGDTSLRRVADVLSRCVGRPGDLFARYEAARFAVLLPFTRKGGAVRVAERMRSAVYDLAIENERSSLGYLSISAGIAAIVPQRETDGEELVNEARRWLQTAKKLGRNRVCSDEYESTAVNAQPRASSRNNLPMARTSFVGRAADIVTVRTLLEEHRLVTIVGPGGTGKTRTSIEAAREIVDRFEDGTWFIDLANLTDLSSVLIAIAARVRFGAIEPDEPRAFAARLQNRKMLLILDNCEHLMAECRALAQAIRSQAPGVTLLLTSREPLGLRDEQVYRLPTLGTEDAVRLFVDRARQYGAAAGDREGIARIVQRLDGMPLAIELAAARLQMMSLEELETALDDALTVLRRDAIDVPVRQQTIRALIDWSYERLDDDDRRLFRRLGVFPSTWDLAAVEPVTGCDVRALESLVAKSLVERLESGGHTRFRFLNVTREYALSFLLEAGERDAVTEAHAKYFAQLAQTRAQQLYAMPMTPWLALQQPELRNYLQALRQTIGALPNAERGELMLESLRHWTHERGLVDFGELLPFFESVREQPHNEALVAAVSLVAADVYGNRDLRRRRECAEQALRFYRDVNDGVSAAHALERFASAQRYLEGGVDTGLESTLRNGVFAAKRYGDKRLGAMLLRVLSDVYMIKRDPESERAVLVEAYELLHECGDDDRCGAILGRLSVAEFWRGDYDQARDTCRSAITLFEQAGEPWNVAFLLMNLGLFEIYRNDFTSARVVLQKSLGLLERYGHQYASANIFLYYALLAHRTAQDELSARLAAYGDALFAAGPRLQSQLRQLHDELAAQLRQSLGGERYERLTAAGASMTHDAAIAEAALV